MSDKTVEQEETVTQETETQELNEETTPDLLDLPDDEFENLDLDDLEDSAEETADNEDNANGSDNSEDTNLDETTEETTDTTSDSKSEEETVTTEDESSEEESQENTGAEEDGNDDTKGENPETSNTEIDYKAAYQQILSPIKANGREIKVDSIDEAVTLMQMGANYNKKMAALKPGLKALKALESNKLLEEGKLDFLIDVAKGNPEAITKLLKEANIDPMDIDTDTDNAYKPTKHQVSDEELALDNVFEEIRENDSFDRTVKVVTDEMDDKSQTVLASNPEVIKVIDAHIQAGIYDQVMNVVEKERALGKLKNISDLDAYKMVGDKMHEAGLFNKGEEKQEAETKETPISKKKQDKEVVAKKKNAARPVRSTPANTNKKPFDPLSMPDEEFEKIAGSTYY